MSEQEAKQRIERLENVLGTLITWIGASANSPLSRQDAAELLQMLNAWQKAEKVSKFIPPSRM